MITCRNLKCQVPRIHTRHSRTLERKSPSLFLKSVWTKRENSATMDYVGSDSLVTLNDFVWRGLFCTFLWLVTLKHIIPYIYIWLFCVILCIYVASVCLYIYVWYYVILKHNDAVIIIKNRNKPGLIMQLRRAYAMCVSVEEDQLRHTLHMCVSVARAIETRVWNACLSW